MGVDLNRQCTVERGPDGRNLARTITPRWLPLAMDSQLVGANRYQYVALSIVSTVNPRLLSSYFREPAAAATAFSSLSSRSLDPKSPI